MNKKLVLLSGGLDSTIAMRLAAHQHGSDKVMALSFDYQQKQAFELLCASRSSKKLNVHHKILNIGFLNEISKGFCANTDPDIPVPKIKEVLGLPQPKTYVPNRNMILMAIAASYAEVNGCDEIYTGFQSNDEYGYYDTTKPFVDHINSALSLNRTTEIKVTPPFVHLNKTMGLEKLLELDGNFDLTKITLSCYNPDVGVSCGECPSCCERIQAFLNIGQKDPIRYKKEINWR